MHHRGLGLSHAARPRCDAPIRPARLVLAVLLGSGLAACTVGPNYVRAPAPVSAKFKEQKGWKLATPSETVDRGPWWSVYRDKRLDGLVRQVEISNETVKAAAASYEEARAIIRQAQSSLFPTLTGGDSVTRSFVGARAAGVSNTVSTSGATTVYSPQAQGTWSPDIWGKIRRQIESNVAAAQASAADLANVTLSAQAMLAAAYFNLAATDSRRALLDRTIVNYQRTLEIVRNHYTTGTVSRADVTAAETQLLNTQSLVFNTVLQRAQLEHAIAVLTGRPPAELSLAPRGLAEHVPKIPVMVPSALLERRPDVAAAERQMQEQNALIGVALAAYYPNITLNGTIGFTGNLPLPLNVGNVVWTAAAAASETVFDGGLRGAQVDAARAVYMQSVANYRQIVLTAFQQVEDQLAAVRTLTKQLKVMNDAVVAAQQTVDTYMNQYRTGVIGLTTIIVAQSTLLATEDAALGIRQSLFVASVNLIEALGGGWDTSKLPSDQLLVNDFSLLPQL